MNYTKEKFNYAFKMSHNRHSNYLYLGLCREGRGLVTHLLDHLVSELYVHFFSNTLCQ